MKRILQIITLLTIIAILASCSVTKKNKSSYKESLDITTSEKIDSSNLKSTDSVSVKKDNSITTVETEDNYKRETVIEFDTSRLNDWIKNLGPGLTQEFIDSMNDSGQPVKTGWITAADYFPKNLNSVKKITIRETGTKKENVKTILNKTDSSKIVRTDSGKLVKTVSSDLHQTETVTTKEKETTSYWGWLWLALIVGATVYVCWRFGVLKLLLKRIR